MVVSYAASFPRSEGRQDLVARFNLSRRVRQEEETVAFGRQGLVGFDKRLGRPLIGGKPI
jgi:hypothetical protein